MFKYVACTMSRNQIPAVFPKIIRCFGDYITVGSKSKNQVEIDKLAIAKDLYQRIKAGGPITVADYMKTVLVNPHGGYYMTKDVFGPKGDFVTSPELGQMCGEMIAIWFLNEWLKVGCPKPLNIVELGPGKGTLCQDMLRVFDHFQALKEASVHLVEVSPVLSDLQCRMLCYNGNLLAENQADHYREGISSYGIPVRWYKDFKVLPEGFTFLIAHEFFDALPVHKFVKTPNGYRELLVDINFEKDCSFRFVQAKEETPMSKLLLDPNEKRDHVEVSPQSLLLMKEISARLQTCGGFALIADYGHLGEGQDTFRAYRKHEQCDPLEEAPGSADLTADVDFRMLKQAADDQGGVLTLGPVTQRSFLLGMGMRERMEALKESTRDKRQAEILEGNFKFMTEEQHMGSKFKFLGLMPKVLEELVKKSPVAGFSS